MTRETVEGLKELSRKLAALGEKVGGKALRQATLNASTPALKAAKLAAPVGQVAHKTYKGRLVAPGFLKRSIKRKSYYKNGKAVAMIGVKAEAFYGVQFVEKGTKNISAKPWLVPAFVNNRDNMEQRLKDQIKKKIERLARS